MPIIGTSYKNERTVRYKLARRPIPPTTRNFVGGRWKTGCPTKEEYWGLISAIPRGGKEDWDR